LDDIKLTLGNLTDSDAWKAFIDHLRKTQVPSTLKIEQKQKTIPVVIYRPAFIIIIILIVSGLATWHFYNRSISEQPSIVILPFVNLSNDPDKEYFCDGITEKIINNLARLKDLRVISRTSAFYFKDKNLDIRTIGEKLNVENVLEGSVQVSDDRLRITAQLVNVADDSHLWAESYDREIKNIFDLQDNLAKEIVCNLKTRLGCKDDDYVKNYTENVEAYNLYLKGRYIRYTLKQKETIEYFNKAIALDPNYALAYIGLAEAHTFLDFFYGDSMKSSYIRAKEAILKALEIDDTLADAYALLGQIRLNFEWDWIGAETALKKAIEINQDSSMAHLVYHFYLRAMGRTSDSVDEMKLALDLDPFSFFHNHQYAIALEFDGQLDNAIKQAEKTLELWPENPETLTFLGLFHVQKKNYAKGIAILEHALSLMKKKSSFTLGFLGYAYGMSEDKKNANKILSKCLKRWDKGNITPSTMAVIYAGLNEKDKVFEWLNTAIKMQDPREFCLKVIPFYKPFHSDPRWPELVRKMGLEG
jgi:TolB-like protein/Tfp pilus assembly protein PilF